MLSSNLVDNALFLPTAYAFGGVFATSFTAIVAVERRRLGRLFASALFQKWLTWAVLGPLFALAVMAGTVGVASLIGISVAIALIEYGMLVDLRAPERMTLTASGAVIVAIAAIAPQHVAETIVASTLALAVVSLASGDAAGFGRPALAAFGLLYVGVMLAHALFLLDLDGGDGLLLTIGVAVALSDVSAFTVGKMFGRHKLAPRLSPHKTWEGVAGNVLGAYAAFALMAFALPGLPLAVQAVLPGVVALAGVSGDLFESMLKRTHGVKDAGDWLPGFGGLLDRVDSLIFVLPATYLTLQVLS
jgi:phosphatidate cytidylyltransferase